MDDETRDDVIDMTQQRAEQLAAEVDNRRGRKRATSAVVTRAADIVSVMHAAAVAEKYGHPLLAWLLRRFVKELRAKPIIQAVEDE
jgi:hypothetical protein